MSDAVHDAQRLKELQSLPLERKVQITQARIIEWYKHYGGAVCVSFSGGKDSTVLLHIARQLYPDIPAVFSNTGLEYPEIQRFVKSCENVDIVTPAMRFDEVVSTYGYPLIGKEVAEAIYYARRIRSKPAKTNAGEDEIETKGGYPNGYWKGWRRKALQDGKQFDAENYLIETSTARNRRTCLQGKLAPNDTVRAGRLHQGDYEKDERWYDYEPGYRWQYELQGFKKNGVASAKSQFNKEKWLPLARDVPVLVSHYCCFKMKKSPMKKYQHANDYKPILATLAEESRVRKQAWIRHGCNAFEGKSPMSQPMSFWTEQDVLTYIVKNDLPIASVYGEIVSAGADGNEYPAKDVFGNVNCNLHCTGCQRTGCIFCAFGFHLDKGKTRFQLLSETHPRQYEFALEGGAMGRQSALRPHSTRV